MVMTRSLVLEFSDLKILTLECKRCGIQLRFDITKKDFDVPDQCPGCSEPFGAVKHQIEFFRRSYDGLASSVHPIRIEVPGGQE